MHEMRSGGRPFGARGVVSAWVAALVVSTLGIGGCQPDSAGDSVESHGLTRERATELLSAGGGIQPRTMDFPIGYVWLSKSEAALMARYEEAGLAIVTFLRKGDRADRYLIALTEKGAEHLVERKQKGAEKARLQTFVVRVCDANEPEILDIRFTAGWLAFIGLGSKQAEVAYAYIESPTPWGDVRVDGAPSCSRREGKQALALRAGAWQLAD